MVTRTDAGIERAVTEPADHDITELLTGELLDRAARISGDHPLQPATLSRSVRAGWISDHICSVLCPDRLPSSWWPGKCGDRPESRGSTNPVA